MFRIAFLALAALVAATPLAAHDGIHVENAYALTSGPGAMSGAVYFEIVNHSATAPDRLIAAVRRRAAGRASHPPHRRGDGVAHGRGRGRHRRRPGRRDRAPARRADHVMLMGLTRPLADGDSST
jgi:periplasmic copper chaperone A